MTRSELAQSLNEMQYELYGDLPEEDRGDMEGAYHYWKYHAPIEELQCEYEKYINLLKNRK